MPSDIGKFRILGSNPVGGIGSLPKILIRGGVSKIGGFFNYQFCVTLTRVIDDLMRAQAQVNVVWGAFVVGNVSVSFERGGRIRRLGRW